MSTQSYYRVTLLGLLCVHKLQKKSIKSYACGGKSVLEPGYIPHNVVLTPQEFRNSECTYAAAEVSQSAPIN